MKYGYNDERFFKRRDWTAKRVFAFALALLILTSVWVALDYKLLTGSNWISPTYDNEDWRTNEGNLHTFGAWDIESHIWKTQYMQENFPNIHWNKEWYLGMPLYKYYQQGFYLVTWGTIELFNLHPARAAMLLAVFGHLIATLLTFLLCYKISRRIWVSVLASVFLLSNTFISLRSYGWEPITVVFLFLYPLGLLIFLRNPTRPFRLAMILVLGLAYLCHPLIWFSLCMMMGLYLLVLALRKDIDEDVRSKHYLWAYFALVGASLLVGAVQFIPQLSYEQATSGAHMGVTYLPYYQVPPNIISLKDFFFDMGNLKGPGPIIMVSALLILTFLYLDWRLKKQESLKNPLVAGIGFVLFVMVLFYYMELYNIFPMNLWRSIQYHRIIPEFIITAAALIAALSNVTMSKVRRTFYYTTLIAFALASLIVVYNVQTFWVTSDTISDSPEFITDDFEGRISMPYTDQSLAVRSSFNRIPQTYGYYEQGITNAYNDEIFSVSSGYHNRQHTVTYLQAANVARLYVNMEEGERDRIVRARLNNSLPFNHNEGDRYGYFEIPLKDPSFVQVVDMGEALNVKKLELGCREMFQEEYCGSVKEEFVSTDYAEIKYMEEYVNLLESSHPASAKFTEINPQQFLIEVENASNDTAIVVKMTHDDDFSASSDGVFMDIETLGPQFMLILPEKTGDYDIILEYNVSKPVLYGAYVSIASIILLLIFFTIKAFGLKPTRPKWLLFKAGDMRGNK